MRKLEHLFLAALFVSGLLLFGCSSGSNGFQITTDSLPNATINVAYSQTLTASGGAAPYTWTIISGMLPTGLTLISSTGVISGTPTSNGTYPFTVKATDATNATTTKPLSITVGNSGSGALQITTTSLPAGTVGSLPRGNRHRRRDRHAHPCRRRRHHLLRRRGSSLREGSGHRPRTGHGNLVRAQQRDPVSPWGLC